MQKKSRGLVLALALASFSLWPLHAPQAAPWKDESGHGGHHKGHGKPGGKAKYEYQAGDCKYEYKAGPGGYKEEVKCKGPQQPAGGPPPWAPAHGYRAQHGGQSTAYVPPFGIDAARCDREALGRLLGGLAGGLLGTQIGKGSGNTAAIIGGTLLGYLIGGNLGRHMDALDHACIGQILEHAPAQRSVTWRNPDADIQYAVTPTRTYQEADGRYCREYLTRATIGGERQQVYGTACRQPDGAWQVAN